jgi:hypothetical protein
MFRSIFGRNRFLRSTPAAISHLLRHASAKLRFSHRRRSFKEMDKKKETDSNTKGTPKKRKRL